MYYYSYGDLDVIFLKILLLQDAEWKKKGPHQQHHLMELLSLRGHEIMVIGFDQLWKEEKNSSIYSKRSESKSICRFYKGAKVDFIKSGFIKIPLLDYLSFCLSSRIDINHEVISFKPNIIIGFSGILTNYWGLNKAKKLNIPYIYYCYDNPSALMVPRPFIRVAEKIVCHIMRKSDKVLTINKALNEYVISLGSNSNTTEVLPQGVDLKRFDVSAIDRDQVRKKYNIDENDLVLFFMGWLYLFLGLKEIILDIYRYKDENPNIKLIIVGYGPDFKNLESLIERYHLQDRVILTGKRPYEEIPLLISAADICLQPAYDDPVIRDIAPIKLYEYLAMHKPVISTKLPGVFKEFGYSSGLIYVKEPKDILEKVIRLSNTEIESNRLNAENFIKNYSWDSIVYDFEQILSNLVNR